MSAIPNNRNKRFPILILAVLLALFAAVAYMLISLGTLNTGNLQPSEEPAGIIYAAAGCYLLGGILILLRRRWLWILGAVMNALVVVFFFASYINRPEVLTSPGGLLTKTVQLLLEVILVYLIITDRRGAKE